jgi:anti-sigma factor RsiW
MTCRDFIEFLMDYESGVLPEAERAVFDAHLAECPPCVAYLRTYRDTIQLGQAAHRSQPPENIPQELVHAILAARSKSKP